MAKCRLCGKGAIRAVRVARTGTRGYVKRRSKRFQKPNLRRVKVLLSGKMQTIMVCAQCLKTRIKAEKVG